MAKGDYIDTPLQFVAELTSDKKLAGRFFFNVSRRVDDGKGGDLAPAFGHQADASEDEVAALFSGDNAKLLAEIQRLNAQIASERDSAAVSLAEANAARVEEVKRADAAEAKVVQLEAFSKEIENSVKKAHDSGTLSLSTVLAAVGN